MEVSLIEVTPARPGEPPAVTGEGLRQRSAGEAIVERTANTPNNSALLIAVLVIGGFFQIQTLQKVAQIGMLKAIGTPNSTIAVTTMIQTMFITLLGVLIAGLAALGLSLSFPPKIPIVFQANSTAMALASVVLIGPLGRLVSISLQPGAFVALVGPSGSGETTPLAMLAGLLQPTSSSITIAGQELGTMNERERAPC